MDQLHASDAITLVPQSIFVLFCIWTLSLRVSVMLCIDFFSEMLRIKLVNGGLTTSGTVSGVIPSGTGGGGGRSYDKDLTRVYSM